MAERAQRVPARRLDEDHVGAEVGEDPSRHRGRLAGEVDDARAGEEWFAHRHVQLVGSARAST
jgi:hypothetical protein